MTSAAIPAGSDRDEKGRFRSEGGYRRSMGRERDDEGRFTSDSGYSRGRFAGRRSALSRPYGSMGRNRDEEGRFMSEGGSRSRGRYDDEDDRYSRRSMGRDRDDEGRFSPPRRIVRGSRDRRLVWRFRGPLRSVSPRLGQSEPWRERLVRRLRGSLSGFSPRMGQSPPWRKRLVWRPGRPFRSGAPRLGTRPRRQLPEPFVTL